jgi:hypothetical protein
MFSFDITFSGITSLLNFIKLLIGSKVICGDTANSTAISQASLSLLGKVR